LNFLKVHFDLLLEVIHLDTARPSAAPTTLYTNTMPSAPKLQPYALSQPPNNNNQNKNNNRHNSDSSGKNSNGGGHGGNSGNTTTTSTGSTSNDDRATSPWSTYVNPW
jgi:hypothetical protein